MDATTPQILPPQIADFRLPPGMEPPPNVVLTEDEAARFCRETPKNFRNRRFAGTGPAFVQDPAMGCGARYLVWDLISWLCSQRHAVQPRTPRSSRRAAA